MARPPRSDRGLDGSAWGSCNRRPPGTPRCAGDWPAATRSAPGNDGPARSSTARPPAAPGRSANADARRAKRRGGIPNAAGTAGWSSAPAANRVRADPEWSCAWASRECHPSYGAYPPTRPPPAAPPTDRRCGAFGPTLPSRAMPTRLTLQPQPTRSRDCRHPAVQAARQVRRNRRPTCSRRSPRALRAGAAGQEGWAFGPRAYCRDRSRPPTATSRCPRSA